MLRISLVFGTIAGLIVIAVLIAGLTVLKGQSFISTEWFGYLTMIVALSMIFLGIKRYRDNEMGGVIKFLPAFGLGLGIAVVAGVIYVAVWEGYQASTNYAFIDAYTAAVIAGQKAKGISGAELQSVIDQMQTLKVQYANPLFRLPMTFLEIFPVGLIIALISAAVLRNHRVLPARA